MKSRIDEDKVILKETEKAMKSPIIQREANNLVEKYLRGLNPNKGSRPLFGNVHELRGEEGARVYYRMKGDTFEILGKSDKHNQQTVIDRLRKLYN
ncbi:hypothetical protein [Brevibacillus laterosporus]|uniref:hypothetical protein n=1 Tax=Brevibacillus laterosporus TaxID=1465 RepID=UPI000ADB5EF0|nr:hypothetical protein [Brevibacillus laterosporus]